jgi:acetolactate synthase-1/2/3 large subunit/sulfoacetaldehyde acetyltransferase
MPRMTAGEAVIESLRAEGVRYIFGVVGSAFLDILDALYGRQDIEFISVRHEQGAAFMADGYARTSGVPGVCLVTSGPGAINLATGIAAAYAGHSPVVAIAGAPMREHQYRESFQEFDHISIFRPITKLSIPVNRAERIPEIFRYAFRTAMSGKRGPVFIDIPRDLLHGQTIEAETQPPETYRLPRNRLEGDPELVQRAAQVLLGAERPVVIAGGGVNWSGANQEVVEMADLLGGALMTSYGRNDAIPNSHPAFLGALGRAGSPEAAEAMRRADVILAVGSRLSHFTTFYDNRYIPREARIIQIDIDLKEIGRNYPIAVGIQGDARAVMTRLLGLVRAAERPVNQAWRQEVEALASRRRARLEEEGKLTTLPVKPQRVYYELRRALPRDAIVTLDAGAAVAYGYDRLHFEHPGTFITPLDLGGLGFGFPEALGAKLARPERTVVSLNGDGGFLFNAQEMETAVRCRIPVIAIVMNNGCWGSEKAYQKYFYNERYVGADITNPRYDRFAELFGGRGFYVERPEDLGDALREAMGLDVPSIIEIPIDPQELPIPPRAADALRR